jgi:hypothetical protein
MFIGIIFLFACEKPTGTLSVRFDTIGGSAANPGVKVRLYGKSSLAATSPSGQTVNASGNTSFTLKSPDSVGQATGSDAEMENGNYLIHAVVNNVDGSDYSSGSKILYKKISIEGDTEVRFSSIGEFTSSAMPAVTANVSVASGAPDVKNGTLYCLWFTSDVSVNWGGFSNGQIMSITSGTFTATNTENGSGTANAVYGSWFGLMPGRGYNAYCFVDANTNNLPDYAVEYHGKLYNVDITQAQNLSLSIFVE